MKQLNEFSSKIDIVFTDIDDTLTDDGRLGKAAYSALWDLKEAGIQVVPVTGRPAGWCEMIVRQWPVDAVVGENGGFYFRYLDEVKKMKRHFVFTEQTQRDNREKLRQLERKILSEVPGSAHASDQFCRLMDLAIDYCEDVKPLDRPRVRRIVELFKEAGAVAKVSSIHVNGWFGHYDKLSMVKKLLSKEFVLTENEAKGNCAFVGDSPNDEPMFAFFPHSFGVANVSQFSDDLGFPPNYVSEHRGGEGAMKQLVLVFAANETTASRNRRRRRSRVDKVANGDHLADGILSRKYRHGDE